MDLQNEECFGKVVTDYVPSIMQVMDGEKIKVKIRVVHAMLI